MNIEDSIKNSNSWHWLVCVLAVSAVASCFVPEYGWRDVLAYKARTLSANEKRAQDNFDEMKDLSQVDVAQLKEQAGKAREATKRTHDDFARYGMEDLPVGDKIVFAAQSRVAEALSKRRLRIVATEAKVKGVSVAFNNAAVQKPVPQPEKAMTPEQIIAEAERTASQIKDRKMAQMILDDARRLAARARERGAQVPARGTAPLPAVRPTPARLPFKTENLEYKVTGNFRDMFMFLVAETHKRPYYNFRDVSVVREEDGTMDLTFTLQVNHR